MSESETQDKSQEEKSPPAVQKNWLEWTVFVCGLLLTLATVGYLAYDALTLEEKPPSIALKLGEPRILSTPGGEKSFMVPVEAFNRGQQTAEGVHIEVSAKFPGAPEQSADYDIAFLPRGSSREGWVAFEGDPKQAKLDARVLGFEIP